MHVIFAILPCLAIQQNAGALTIFMQKLFYAVVAVWKWTFVNICSVKIHV